LILRWRETLSATNSLTVHSALLFLLNSGQMRSLRPLLLFSFFLSVGGAPKKANQPGVEGQVSVDDNLLIRQSQLDYISGPLGGRQQQQ